MTTMNKATTTASTGGEGSHFTVTCPTCTAPPRKQCRTLTTGKPTEPHRARLDAQYPACRDCGCQEKTHPIETCHTFRAPLAEPTYAMSFNVAREAYYYEHIRHVMEDAEPVVLDVGMYSTTGGGCKWEFHLVEDKNAGNRLRLKMWDEGWIAFAEAPEFFAGLAELGSGTFIEEVVEMMLGLGYRDITKRTAEGNAFMSGARL